MNKLKTQKADVVMRYFMPVTAGIEINVLQTYRTLAKLGWDITIHTSNDTYTEKRSLPKEDLIDGLKVKRYNFGLFGFKPKIDWNKTNTVCLHNFDMFPHFQLMVKVLWLKIMNRKSFGFFITPHGGFNPEWSVFSDTDRLIKKSYTYSLGTLLLNLTADGIRAVSPWEKEEMIKKGIRSSKIKVITNGLEDEAYGDINLASPKIKELVQKYPRYILDNSRIKNIKNIDLIIKAVKELPEDVHFLHIGTTQNPEYKESILNLAKELNIEGRVHFLGVIRGTDKYYLYKNAVAFVHPAIWEANANVVHEAWSQRLLTIVGDSTGMRSQVQDGINGIRADIHDAPGLAKKINAVLENKNSAEFESMKDKNMEYVSNHSWKQVGERMGQFYSEIYDRI